MARSIPAPAVTAERAARPCRLIRLLGTRKPSRETLLRLLKLDVRGFYRDMKLLRDVGIHIDLIDGRYVLRGEAGSAVLLVPFPDPHLTLGEAVALSRGRTATHLKLRQLLAEVLPR